MSTVTKSVPILDLKPEVAELWPELSERMERVFKSGQFIMGPECKELEASMAQFLGVKHALGCNSGTDALIIGLRSVGVQPGDEVITTPFSFFATAESISLVGAKPVFVDVEVDSMNIDPRLIEAAITEKTSAIMPVHLFGRPANMGAIMEIAERHGLKVIEDAAKSIGAAYHSTCAHCTCSDASKTRFHGKQTGSIGHVGAFSFFPTKNLGAYGDAGLITTNDDDVAEMAMKLRNHGSILRYKNEILGYNSRLDSVQAAVLNIKLPRTDSYNAKRRALANRYNVLLAEVDGVITPEVTDGHVFHQYTIRVTSADRDALVSALNQRGVGAMVYYPTPQDRLPVYAGQYPHFAVNETLSAQVLSLPIHPYLSNEDQDYVVATLIDVLRG